MANKEMLLKLKDERLQLQNEQQSLTAQIEEVNEQIASYKKTATYQKWKQLYERAMKEVNREKNSSNMNMDKYQNMMREVKKMRKAYPLADLTKQKKDLEVRLADVSKKIIQNKKDARAAKIEKSPVKNEEQKESKVEENQASKESAIGVNTAKIGVIEGLQQMANLQAQISRIQATERIKKITDVVADLSVNVDAKINLAVMSYKKHRAAIEAAKGEYETKINEIVDQFRDNMVVLEEGKQAIEQKEAECLSKLAMKNDEIEFRKRDESYKKWLVQYKKNSAQIKRLKGTRNMDMDTYQKLLKEHLELKAKNPLNRNMAECKELADELAQIREQSAESEQKKAAFYQEQLQAFAEATQERDNKLVLVEKKGAFKRFIGGLADRINSKKRVENSVVAPLKQLTERLGKISANLADKKQQYMEEITPLINGNLDTEQKSITDVIENGKRKKESIISVLKKKVQESRGEKAREQEQMHEQEPVVHVQRLMEIEA